MDYAIPRCVERLYPQALRLLHDRLGKRLSSKHPCKEKPALLLKQSGAAIAIISFATGYAFEDLLCVSRSPAHAVATPACYSIDVCLCTDDGSCKGYCIVVVPATLMDGFWHH